jgi:hypothetical protein
MRSIEKITTCILLTLTVSACAVSNLPITEHISDLMPIPAFIKQNVFFVSGFDFDNKKLVSLDPTTGQEVPICGSNQELFVNRDSDQNQLRNKGADTHHIEHPCPTTQIVNASSPLNEAIGISREPIKGTIRVEGIDKEATFLVTVTALYRGSHCVTTYSAGTQRTNCINKEKQCAAIRKATNNPNYPC